MRPGLFVLLLALLVSGCAHSRSAEEQASGLFLPEVPAFLSGPMGVLLTNAGGYSSHATFTTGSAAASMPQETISGQLLARGELLLYAPDPQSLDKRLRAIGLSYLWNVKENRGYVLSESLQGCAPVGFGVHYTNVVSSRSGSGPERSEGHSCLQEAVQVAATEGVPTQYQLWRATDLKGLPVRITGGPRVASQTLSLSRVQLEVPQADLFAPPDSFTRYQSPDLMLSEMTLRQHNLKKRPTEEWNEKELSPNSPPQRYR